MFTMTQEELEILDQLKEQVIRLRDEFLPVRDNIDILEVLPQIEKKLETARNKEHTVIGRLMNLTDYAKKNRT